jgi:hypothetical protein
MFLNYPPLTNNLAFLNAPFERVVSAAREWLEPQGSDPPALFNASFDEAIRRLFPLTHWRKLFMECKFGWTAVFKDVDDVPEGPIGTLSRKLRCYGVIGTYYPFKGEDSFATWGAVQLRFYEDHDTDFLNTGRSISVSEGEDGWEFHQNFQPFPFEKTEDYRNPRIKDRFTPEMLVEYLAHLGIDAVDSSKYGPRCALFDVPPDVLRRHEESGVSIYKER